MEERIKELEDKVEKMEIELVELRETVAYVVQHLYEEHGVYLSSRIK